MEPRKDPSRDTEAGLLYPLQPAIWPLLVQVSREGQPGAHGTNTHSQSRASGWGSRASSQGVAQEDKSQLTWASQSPDGVFGNPVLLLLSLLASASALICPVVLFLLPSVSLSLAPTFDLSLPFLQVYLKLRMKC